jgi:penicillin-binding protein-related factor A (putative recombinase)
LSRKLSKVRAGWLAQSAGKSFEARFERYAATNNVTCIKIPSGCKQVGKSLIRVRTPFDFILGYKGRVIFCDLKSTENQTFTYSMITPHQVKYLRAIEHHTSAGYIIEYRSCGEVYFFSAKYLLEIGQRESLDPNRGIKLGSSSPFMSLDFNLFLSTCERSEISELAI